MPPKARITREMIADAAVEAVRRGGPENISVRTVAGILQCSTQPVMYHFPTVAELRKEAYDRTDALHTGYLLNALPGRDPMLSIGLNYIRFAAEEPNLFRFLFQSGYADRTSLSGLLSPKQTKPVLDAFCENAGTERARAEEIFITLAMTVHGYTSLVANGMLEYDENNAAALLERAFTGALNAAASEDKNESNNR
jgi:AcrR family transcriptional regulator